MALEAPPQTLNTVPSNIVSDIAPSPIGDEDGHHDRMSSLVSPSGIRKRRASKGTIPAVVKRSLSTPNVRSLASADTSAMSLAEKRRNKLGYHRTSVACGHCRRRKIRCLLAAEDAQGRCSNCIRLKKECNFFPVDQQPQVDRRHRSGSKTEPANETSTSSSSSPAMAGGHVIEQVENYHPYPPLSAISSSQDIPSFVPSFGGTTVSPLNKVTPSHGYEVGPPYERTSTWDTSPFMDQSPLPPASEKSHPDDHANAYWRMTESPMTPVHPHQFSTPQSLGPHYPRDPNVSFSVPGARDDAMWPYQPSRTMSLVSAEDLPPHFHQNDYSQHNFHDRRRMTNTSELYPPSLDTSNNSSSASISEPQSAPLTGSFSHQITHTPNYPPTWNQFPGHHSPAVMGKGPEGFHGWYAEPHHLAQVKEEEFGPSFHARYPPHAQRPV